MRTNYMNKNFLIAVVIILGVAIFIFGINKFNNTTIATMPVDELQWPIESEPNTEEIVEEPQEEPLPDEPTSYKEALKIAKAKDKNILLYFSADWCKYCKEMKKTTLQDESVKNAIENYVFYIVDTDEEGDIARQYGVSGIPAYRIITDTEEVKKKSAGYMSVKTFLNWLEVK